MKNVIKLIPLIIFFGMCSKKAPEEEVSSMFSKNFIQCYGIVESLECIYYQEISNLIFLNVRGDGILNSKFSSYGNPNSQELFKKFAEQWGDTCYNSIVPIGSQHSVIADEFTINNITCDKDFNNYLAGESLNGIIEFIGKSCYKFVKSGYKDKFDWNTYNWQPFVYYADDPIDGYHLIKKRLSEITSEDMVLLYPSIVLEFTEKPVAGDYVFTINFTLKGKEILDSVSVKFK